MKSLFTLCCLILSFNSFSHGDLESSIKTLDGQLNKNKIKQLLKRGHLNYQKGEYIKAIHDLEHVLEADHYNDVAIYFLSQAHLANNDLTSATRYAQKYLNLGEMTLFLVKGHALLADIYLLEKKYTLAFSEYKESIRHNIEPKADDYITAARTAIKTQKQDIIEEALQLVLNGIERLGPLDTLRQEAASLKASLGNHTAQQSFTIPNAANYLAALVI